jgi:hypothetical protein
MKPKEHIGEWLSFALILFVTNAWLIPWWNYQTLSGSNIAVWALLSLLGSAGYRAAMVLLRKRRERKQQ